MDRNSILINYLEQHVQAPLGDLDQMNQITGEFDCSIPMAMTIISNLELIGYFLDNTSNIEKTKPNIERALESDTEAFGIEYKTNLELIVYYFRHGMMHGFFPQLEHHSNGKINIIGIKKIINSHLLIESDCTLNVSRLYNDFKIFIDNLKLKYSIRRSIKYFEVSRGIER